MLLIEKELPKEDSVKENNDTKDSEQNSTSATSSKSSTSSKVNVEPSKEESSKANEEDSNKATTETENKQKPTEKVVEEAVVTPLLIVEELKNIGNANQVILVSTPFINRVL